MIEKILNRVSEFSANHPRLIIGLTIAITVIFATQFRKVAIDTDPKNMLPITSAVRQYNDQVEREFSMHPDVIALGIVNEKGIVNRDTLSSIMKLTEEIQKMPGVISRDVISLSTIDNVTAQGGGLDVRPVLERIPASESDAKAFKDALLSNPLFINRIVSADATATAIYAPIEAKANGKEIADKIRALLPTDSGDDKYFLAGDPVARDTFGEKMFSQMGRLSPIAGLVMAIALFIMFRSLPLVIANMAAAMVGIIWAMGLFIGLGYPIHIMSSMSPVFLMAIATDSVHIFNEFAFRFAERRNKKQAVLETIKEVAIPVFYSDTTTAVGFASLATVTIIPVKIFGLLVGFGTLVILLMSFTLIPAILMLLDEKSILKSVHKEQGDGAHSMMRKLAGFCVDHTKTIAVIGAIFLIVGVVGLFQIRVNNNLVHWFKYNSDVRTADRVMSAKLGGTSTAYLVVQTETDDAIKDPAMLAGIEGLQRELERDPRVGKTFSVVDYVKRVNLVLHDNDNAFNRVPDTADEAGQYLFLFGMSAKPRDLDNVVDYPFRKANIMLQLKTWDADVMEEIIKRAEQYLSAHPLPSAATIHPAGIAYFNLIWNNEVLKGMMESFIAGLAMVLILLMIQMRSFWWGILSYVPLFFTIILIYGAVGLFGKDFDMPVAVLSTLSLGMAVDFAIHFVGRFQQRYKEHPNLKEALIWTVVRPGKGVLLNAVLFAIGFSVMVFAELTPYITVGAFMAGIMLFSALFSVIYLPGLITIFSPILIKKGDKK